MEVNTGSRIRQTQVVPSDEDDEEMTYDQRRLIRRFRKAGRASIGRESGRTDLKG
jgi:hypothetical protein